MGVEVVHLLLTAQVAVAREGDDFHVGAHDEESHVEPHLVVAGSRGTVGDGIGSDFLGVARNGHALENTFGRHGDGVDIVAQHVAVDHELEALLVVFVGNVERHVLLCAQLVGVFFVGLELFFAKATGVGTGGIHFVAFFLGQIHYGVRGIQTAAEGDHNFLFHGNNLLG